MKYPKLPHKSGWVQVEEFVLWPLHKEPHFALKASGEAFRKGEEKKAAAEFHKAIVWLRLMESHATPEGKRELSEADGKLATIAAGLYLQEAGRSAEHQLSKDVNTSVKALDSHGKSDGDKIEYGNILADHLKAVGDGLQQLGAELQQPLG